MRRQFNNNGIVIVGISERIKQVIREHDPYHLHRPVTRGDCEEQYARHGDERRGEQQPRARLALFCARAVDDIAHDYIRHSVDYLDTIGNTARNAPPHTVVRFRTSV